MSNVVITLLARGSSPMEENAGIPVHPAMAALRDDDQLLNKLAYHRKPNRVTSTVDVSAEVDGIEVGRYVWDTKRREIGNLFVPEPLRRKGMAKQLLDHCVLAFGLPVYLRANPFAVTSHNAPQAMSKAQLGRFYGRYGFQPDTQRVPEADGAPWLVLDRLPVHLTEGSDSLELDDLVAELGSAELPKIHWRWQANAAEEDDEKDDLHTHYQKVIANLNQLHRAELRRLRQDVERAYSVLDNQVVQEFSPIIAAINDEASSIIAIQTYTFELFREMVCSYNAKQELAKRLIVAITPYRRYIPQIWQDLAEGSLQLDPPLDEQPAIRVLPSQLRARYEPESEDLTEELEPPPPPIQPAGPPTTTQRRAVT